MEAVLVLITFGNLVFYEISNQSHEFCPYSQLFRGTDAACVFNRFVCHNK